MLTFFSILYKILLKISIQHFPPVTTSDRCLRAPQKNGEILHIFWFLIFIYRVRSLSNVIFFNNLLYGFVQIFKFLQNTFLGLLHIFSSDSVMTSTRLGRRLWGPLASPSALLFGSLLWTTVLVRGYKNKSAGAKSGL